MAYSGGFRVEGFVGFRALGFSRGFRFAGFVRLQVIKLVAFLWGLFAVFRVSGLSFSRQGSWS